MSNKVHNLLRPVVFPQVARTIERMKLSVTNLGRIADVIQPSRRNQTIRLSC
jgi:hypothetical protein